MNIPSVRKVHSPLRFLYHHRTGSRDGQAVHIEELITALREQGSEVTVVEPRSVSSVAFGGESRRLTGLRDRLPTLVADALEFAYSALAFWRLRRAYLRVRPDVLYERYNLFLVAGVWVKKLYGVPMLLEVNSPLFEERSKHGRLSLQALARWSERYVWRNADYVLPVTGVLADIVIAEGVLAERVVVVPNGVNTERFGRLPRTDLAKRRVGMEGRLVLGFTGFVRDWHGLEQIVDFLATPGHENYRLLVVGDGPARGALEARAIQQGIADRVQFTGVVSRGTLSEYVAAFDIALQPAANQYASPLKLFEYMIMGRAIIAPDQSNIREVLTDQHDALLFSVTQPHDLLAKIEVLARDTDLRERIGRRAAETIMARDYTWGRNAARVLDLARGFVDQRTDLSAHRATTSR